MQIKVAQFWPGRIRSTAQAGMTLIEVVVALVIAVLTIGGIVNAYNFCTNASQKSALSLAASALAQQRVEETRSAIWDTAAWPPVDQLYATNFPTRVVTLDVSGNGKVVIPATIYTYITPIPGLQPLKRVRVDCVWQSKGKQWQTNSIETCRAPKQ
jgi:Tfp pilus assembly protein PilV